MTGLLGLFAYLAAFGQALPPGVFEVASVKVSPPVSPNQRVYFGPARGGPGTPDPAQITWTYATMKSMLMTAWDVKPYQISGPAWITSERYDIAAKVPAGTTKDQVGAMWQHLLADRFGVALHHEAREFQVEELVVGKGGAKLEQTKLDEIAPPPEGPQVKNGQLLSVGVVSMILPGGKAHTMARAQLISQLANMLGNQIDRPVLDKTGLNGRYDFTLDYRLNGPPGPDGDTDPGPDLATAVQQQLGLVLVAAKAKIDVLVIDQLEKIPTAN